MTTEAPDAQPFRIIHRAGDCVLYLSGWSQHRLQPTFSARQDDGLIWTNEAKLERWQAKHSAFGPSEWAELQIEKEALPPARDRGGERFRRLNRRR